MRRVIIPEAEGREILDKTKLVPLDKVYCVTCNAYDVTLSKRTSLPSHGIYLGNESDAAVPEIVVDEQGDYVLVFHRK